MHALRRWCLLSCLVLTLSACAKKIELQTAIPENDANEIVAVLVREGIDAEKQSNKENATVLVNSSDIAKAMLILQSNGLPRKQNMGLGEVFKKEGMISTPLEERARYIFGLSQELERTLSQIDQVTTARVHVVLPERIAPGEPILPSSAAVFIKYRKGFDIDGMTPNIRRLVSTSIPGLNNIDKEKISVVFVPSPDVQRQIEWNNFLGIIVDSKSLGLLQWIVYGLFILGMVGSALFLITLLQPVKMRRFFQIDKS